MQHRLLGARHERKCQSSGGQAVGRAGGPRLRRRGHRHDPDGGPLGAAREDRRALPGLPARRLRPWRVRADASSSFGSSTWPARAHQCRRRRRDSVGGGVPCDASGSAHRWDPRDHHRRQRCALVKPPRHQRARHAGWDRRGRLGRPAGRVARSGHCRASLVARLAGDGLRLAAAWPRPSSRTRLEASRCGGAPQVRASRGRRACSLPCARRSRARTSPRCVWAGRRTSRSMSRGRGSGRGTCPARSCRSS